MSYILDALKKSEQERQQGINPTLQTIYRPQTLFQHGWLTYVLMGLIVLLFSALAGLIVYVWQQQPAQTPYSEKSLPEKHRNNASPNDVRVESVLSEKAALSKNKAVESVVLPYGELPDAIRNGIPAMTFSFHVFSENPDRRTIIINGRRVKQGAEIITGLTLLEITETGVIFLWEDTHFSIPVVESW